MLGTSSFSSSGVMILFFNLMFRASDNLIRTKSFHMMDGKVYLGEKMDKTCAMNKRTKVYLDLVTNHLDANINPITVNVSNKHTTKAATPSAS